MRNNCRDVAHFLISRHRVVTESSGQSSASSTTVVTGTGNSAAIFGHHFPEPYHRVTPEHALGPAQRSPVRPRRFHAGHRRSRESSRVPAAKAQAVPGSATTKRVGRNTAKWRDPPPQCNASQSFPPRSSRSFPMSFSESHPAMLSVLCRAHVPDWDRILACVGMAGIPVVNQRKTGRGAPGKSGRAIFAFYSPRPPLGSFTKEMRLLILGLKSKDPPARDVAPEGREPISSEPAPSHRPWASARARPRADSRCQQPPPLQREAIVAVGLYDPTLTASFGDGQLRGALGTFGEVMIRARNWV